MYQNLSDNKQVFKEGMRDGIPIALGYLAVSFSLGIAAKNAGLSAFQGFFASILTNASAGEYAGFTVIATMATYLEMFLVILIANSRYLIMSCALSQRMHPDTPWYHRLLIGFDITDELFAITIARPGYLNPFYTYGAMLVTMPCWSIGTALGIIAGNLLSVSLVSAFSVALYGMFLAIIIPASSKSRAIGEVVVLAAVLSTLMYVFPLFQGLSNGFQLIIATLLAALYGAWRYPVEEKE